MAQVNPKDFPKRRPVVNLALLDNADVAVLTIREVDPDVTFQGRKRMVITFDEYPDHAYWPNSTSINRLIERFGTETNDWMERVALEKVLADDPNDDNPNRKKRRKVESLWVAAADEQDKLIKEYDKAVGKKRK